MKNVTVAIPNHIHRRARIWAAQHDTSLSQIVAYVLENFMSQQLVSARFPPVAPPELIPIGTVYTGPQPKSNAKNEQPVEGCETVKS